MKQTTKIKIEKVQTLEDYLNTLQNEFKVKECAPGRLIKDTVIRTILSKLNGSNVFVNENLRIKAIQTNNIDEFINVIKTNFNTKMQFSDGAKSKLVKDTELLITLTKLKENN